MSGESTRSLKARRSHSLGGQIRPQRLEHDKDEDVDEGMDIDEKTRLPPQSSANRFMSLFRFTSQNGHQGIPRESSSEGDIRSIGTNDNSISEDAKKDKIRDEITKLEAEIQSLHQTIARKEELLTNLRKELGVTTNSPFTQFKEKFQMTFNLKKSGNPEPMQSPQDENITMKDRFKEGSENTMKVIEEKFQSAGSALKRSIWRRSLRATTGT
ncbi:uncharacterized protein TRIADDRAFT_61187 [Trichoplax adhaerens]|uniref:Uncharacterized protein n=1 Tax=Trichoplax adhaerens TaxID=10228 RepID=B3SA99_TRIAD|nr:hypothetical protein TRIADDRAFT_61187 [Trichoplax adhaerens]EDV20399.1 hypothetical protein TRIADDRAFT_61187 [Trichoplax adhaerens]|eukprot:XP_002117093.1 hypothetical protein TRIADDRAFT_61187 [Trichoplax adhaerens]